MSRLLPLLLWMFFVVQFPADNWQPVHLNVGSCHSPGTDTLYAGVLWEDNESRESFNNPFPGQAGSCCGFLHPCIGTCAVHASHPARIQLPGRSARFSPLRI